MTRWAGRARNRADSKARTIVEWLKRHIKPNGKWSDRRVILFTEYRATQNWLVEILALEGVGGQDRPKTLVGGVGKGKGGGVIVFSEYRATQNWLVEILALEGFGGQDRLKTMFGGMEKDKREAVKAAFQAAPNVSPVRILVATDAASEGIDLQNHCDLMIHVEIPWNPNVLEQRNGRIDRHGQKSKEVFIWHPVGAGYREREFHEDIRTGDLEGDLEFLMVAARKVQTIRQDLGKVGHVIADQVEQAMFGRRSRLDTAQAEKEAAAVSRQLAVEKRFQEKVARLHQQLQESRETFRMSPENIRMTVKVALEIAGLPPLQPIDWKEAPSGTVFRMPAFQGTWARCTEGLFHPHTGERRPITFDHAVARGRDDMVLVHLNHRLVQMCLRLLRAEVWALDDVKRLNRVSARVVPDGLLEHPAVVVWARIVVTGARSHRLHEEVTCAGGILQNGRFVRLGVGDTDKLFRASLPKDPPKSVLDPVVGRWDKIEDSVRSAIEARTRDRMKNLESTLSRRCDQEVADLGKILNELKASIEQELGKPQKAQLDLFSIEEKDQVRKDTDSLRVRAEAIPDEIEGEAPSIPLPFADPGARN